MKDKFTLPSIYRAPKEKYPQILVSPDIHASLKEVCQMTGIPITRLASLAIKFALDRLELEE